MEKTENPIQIKELLEFETMLSNLSTQFVEIPADQVDRRIEEGLKLIAEVLNIDRCSVAQLSEDKSELRVTHAYAAEEHIPILGVILNEQQPWYTKQLFQSKSIFMSTIDDLPEEASMEKEHCRLQGIKSSALIPMVVGESFLGVAGFAAFKKERQWPEHLARRLRMVGVVFANAITRRRSEKKLLDAFNEIKELKDRLEAENTYLREEIRLQHTHEGIVGQSETIREVLKRAEQVANTDSTVLILGETGTGKELLAQTIHNLSPRNRRPMITVNCAALPSNLVESELLGHEKGAYTGAHSKRIGKFELADGSTLFLDEIGELSLELQAKLLRVLQTSQFERLGGNETIKTDVRVIAATNRNLLQSVNTGEFRMDLYYRLNVFPIVVPPLKNRREDIPDLVWWFVKSFCEKMGKRIDSIPNKSMRLLQSYDWPGNIRELKNVIERGMIITSDKTLKVELPDNTRTDDSRPMTFDEVQKTHILEILELSRWRIRGKEGAAEMLKLKPTTLEAKMRRLGIKRPQRK